MACEHWKECGVVGGGCCSRGLGGGQPSLGFCGLVCDQNTAKGTWPDLKLPPASVVAVTIQPVPLAEWPSWAKAMRLVRRAEDKGVGDTMARIVGAIGGDAWNAWYVRTTGEKCPSCAARQAGFNALYPY